MRSTFSKGPRVDPKHAVPSVPYTRADVQNCQFHQGASSNVRIDSIFKDSPSRTCPPHMHTQTHCLPPSQSTLRPTSSHPFLQSPTAFSPTHTHRHCPPPHNLCTNVPTRSPLPPMHGPPSHSIDDVHIVDVTNAIPGKADGFTTHKPAVPSVRLSSKRFTNPYTLSPTIAGSVTNYNKPKGHDSRESATTGNDTKSTSLERHNYNRAVQPTLPDQVP